MHFAAKKVIVVGGKAGMSRQVAVDIVRRGSAVIVGRSKDRVDGTVADATGRRCHARWGVAELTKRAMARLASSTTLNFASRGSLAQSRPTIDPSNISDEDMACY